MTKLRQLVEQYVSGAMQFPEFRRAFVTDFLAVASLDTSWSTVLQVESECDDFAEGLITEEQLRLNLDAKKYFPSSVVVCPAIEPIVFSCGPLRHIMWPATVTGSTVTVPLAAMESGAGQLPGVTLSWVFA